MFGLSRFCGHFERQRALAKGGVGGRIQMRGPIFFGFCLFWMYEHHLKPLTGDVVSNLPPAP